MGRLEGKVALVTGAASGLGAAAAAMLVEEGARVVAGDLELEKMQTAFEAQSDRVLPLRLDVTSESDWEAAVGRALQEFERLDILVNSAGILLLQDIESTSLTDWRRVHAVNLDGCFLGCKTAIGAMKQTGGGSIINLSSVSGLVGGHNLAAYNASKGGVRLLTKSVALHCARHGYGIRCNSIHPTFIETPMLDALLERVEDPDAVRASLTRQIPLGRLGRTEDVGKMIVYLASDESAFVTGTEMVIDGGATA
ncbi:glucose 1-dehydrogenase [Denitrobaculum tricleocarpae]|uniref:Glucose 1-dehydrogenase n=1 Tax=Denitrobaculum tricleocarpae TaxID=2591009 RepID=A0A545U2Z0_9PROT|nr:glucose 1-dehydrogenase [Denitrobaculum tricleocarpae]TQV83783.1 glucose 1-dehydrogenase [Denitrobaculum tricleocarpae]